MSFRSTSKWTRLTALICITLLGPGDFECVAQSSNTQPLHSADQLDSLTAPVALYPDPLLAEVLPASTYPLEILQAERWLQSNSNLKGENLSQAAAKQPWDPSVQVLVAFPDALKFLDDNIEWTIELGNAFLDQEGDVMEAVQRMRLAAKDTDKLQSCKEEIVETETVEGKPVIEIRPANPQIVYVPMYNPVVIYGPLPSPYPALYYPPASAYYAAAAISFGAGVVISTFWRGCCGWGGWGWGSTWARSNAIVINTNFYTRYGYANTVPIKGDIRTTQLPWQHNPQHRQAVPYDIRATAQRYGGAPRTSGGMSGEVSTDAANIDRGNVNRPAQMATRDSSMLQDQSQRPASDIGENRDRIAGRTFDGNNQEGQRTIFVGLDLGSRIQAASNRGFADIRESRTNTTTPAVKPPKPTANGTRAAASAGPAAKKIQP